MLGIMHGALLVLVFVLVFQGLTAPHYRRRWELPFCLVAAAVCLVLWGVLFFG
ncbi:MAG TPA: hypothetical protein VKV19_13080 [Ktedonobacteraceae bacterium]|nr:hypothetical protein [Ktedonobacteraceae bacterium]